MLTIHEAYQWLSRKYIDDDLAKNTGIYVFGLNANCDNFSKV